MRIDNHTHVGFDPLYYLQGWSPYCLDLTRLFRESEGAGIDAFIVFPFVAYMALDLESLKQKRIELRDDAVPYAFENRRLCDDIRACPEAWQKKLWPFLMADPMRRPEAQVREWERLPADHRVHGIKIQCTTLQAKVTSLLDVGSRILDYAEANNLPLLIHSSIRPDDAWSQCSDILKVAESRPKVRFVLAHSCRYHLPSLKRVAEMPNTWFDCSAHVIHCRCAAENHPAAAVPAERFDTDYSSPETVLRDLANAFPEKLIWGSDIPYYSIQYEHVSMQSSYRREVACLDALPEESRQRACHHNTLAWLGRNA